jgi:hypothetical protein
MLAGAEGYELFKELASGLYAAIERCEGYADLLHAVEVRLMAVAAATLDPELLPPEEEASPINGGAP